MLSTLSFKEKNRLYESYKVKYGAENVLLVTKSRFFFKFYIVLPFIILSIFIGGLIFIGLYKDINYNTYWWFKFSVILILILGNTSYFIKRYLDYLLDFTIFTPTEIVQYNQEGPFSRPIKTVNANKIKALLIEKNSISRSLFNYGTIQLLSDGDQQKGDIEIYHVYQPEIISDKIREILKQI